jgi:hypothetical protein
MEIRRFGLRPSLPGYVLQPGKIHNQDRPALEAVPGHVAAWAEGQAS